MEGKPSGTPPPLSPVDFPPLLYSPRVSPSANLPALSRNVPLQSEKPKSTTIPHLPPSPNQVSLQPQATKLWSGLFNRTSTTPNNFPPPTFSADGLPVVKAPPSIILKSSETWKDFLICHFFGEPPSLRKIHSDLNPIWGKKGPIQVRPYTSNSCLIFIPNQSTRNWVLDKALWSAGMVSFTVELWTPSATLTEHVLSSAPIWLTLHRVPPQLWSAEGVALIASGVGIPLQSDNTESLLSAVAPRIRAIVPLDKGPLPLSVIVEDEDGAQVSVDIHYASLPPLCPTCSKYGHKSHRCPIRSKAPFSSTLPHLENSKTPISSSHPPSVESAALLPPAAPSQISSSVDPPPAATHPVSPLEDLAGNPSKLPVQELGLEGSGLSSNRSSPSSSGPSPAGPSPSGPSPSGLSSSSPSPSGPSPSGPSPSDPLVLAHFPSFPPNPAQLSPSSPSSCLASPIPAQPASGPSSSPEEFASPSPPIADQSPLPPSSAAGSFSLTSDQPVSSVESLNSEPSPPPPSSPPLPTAAMIIPARGSLAVAASAQPSATNPSSVQPASFTSLLQQIDRVALPPSEAANVGGSPASSNSSVHEELEEGELKDPASFIEPSFDARSVSVKTKKKGKKKKGKKQLADFSFVSLSKRLA